MIDKEIIAKALVEKYTPMELAMQIIEAEENRVNENYCRNTLSNESMYLREWCEYLKSVVYHSLGKVEVDGKE